MGKCTGAVMNTLDFSHDVQTGSPADQLIQTERAVSDFLGDLPSLRATISIWSPLQPHLSRLHQVVFLQISHSPI